MNWKPTNEEWAEMLRPYLAQFQKRSARRKLCRLHKNGPVKESKIQCPWPTGETCFATVNARELKIWLLFTDGSSAYMEYNANGDQIHCIRHSPDEAGPFQDQE